MIFFRSRMVLRVMLLVCMGLLVACGASNDPHLLSATDIAGQVGAHYGDTYARITWTCSTEADSPPNTPMYLMTLVGHFHKNAIEAHSLGFSALATRLYVWNVRGYDQMGREVWQDHEMASQM